MHKTPVMDVYAAIQKLIMAAYGGSNNNFEKMK
jgi:hypothetical protein